MSADLLNSTLTPVRFVERQSPMKLSANLASCKARMESLVSDMNNNYAKWKLAHQRGTSLCYAIEAKKTRCLEKADEQEGCYPDDMRAACDKLAIISSIFVDIARNTQEILRQMRALVKLAGSAVNVVFYRTWNLQAFVDFTEELSKRYAQESLVKQEVMQNIAHCMKRTQLIRYTTAWEYPDHVDAYVDLVFRLLAEEIKAK